MSGIGDTFFKETKYTRENLNLMRTANVSARPDLYKEYPGKPRIALPPAHAETQTLDQVLHKRKSIRRYDAKPLTIEQLSYLLWAVAGIQRTEGDFHFRPAPSAGALYPIETYVVVNNVEGVPKGIYHYAIRPHALEELRNEDAGRDIVRATMGQRMHAEAPVAFIWTAIFQRSKFRYHDRAYRYIYLDAGHIAQNLALAAVGLGLASCQVGAYFDDEVNALIGVDGTEESVIYMSVTGWQG
jgi:SagB-type dehydrogenase family enzyme